MLGSCRWTSDFTQVGERGERRSCKVAGPLDPLQTASHSSASRPLSQQYPIFPKEWGCAQVIAPAHVKPEFT